VIGHRQVADAYLAALAASNNSLLATFNHALAQAVPQHVILIP
jgi:predicted nucleic acid-binding protein